MEIFIIPVLYKGYVERQNHECEVLTVYLEQGIIKTVILLLLQLLLLK